ncbi:MAG: L,D-transpeptidase/peptidoglycan binding protein [Lachnospiraceae bacterium]|nr:L,D-transpeptidase/peptidoglycan binding protein [Lachnospiraceae bacterium]
MRRRRRRQQNNIALTVTIVFLALLLAVYLLGTFYFMGRFLPNSTFNEQTVARMTEEEAEELLTDEMSSYALTVVGREETGGTIKASEISLKPVFNGIIGECIDGQNPFTWPVSFFNFPEFHSESVVDYDENRLLASLSALGIFDNERPPKDAYLSEYSNETGYTVIPEDPGTTLNRETTEKVVKEAVENLQPEVVLEEEDCYLQPEVFQDDPSLTALRDNLNKFVQIKLTIDYGDNSETVDGELIGQWISVEGTEVTLDETKVKDYVDSLAKAHDTFGIAREFKTRSGETITVRGGNYGWWTDRPNTTTALIEAIYKGESGEFEPVYFSEAVTHGDSDIGDDYVEVDLDNQHVYVYKDGQMVVDSDCVSGKVSAGNYTPDGTYAITYKERDATLVGETYSSAVSYWMPFNGNIGMHDASWRSSFGGDIYITGGSHGCVNLPKKKAAEIFDYVEKGEPVIVYGGKQEVPQTDKPDVTELTEEQQQALLQLILQQQAEAMDGQINEGQ